LEKNEGDRSVKRDNVQMRWAKAVIHLPSVTSADVVPGGHARVGSTLGEGLLVGDRTLFVVSSKGRVRGVGRGQRGRHQGGKNKCCDRLHADNVNGESKSTMEMREEQSRKDA